MEETSTPVRIYLSAGRLRVLTELACPRQVQASTTLTHRDVGVRLPSCKSRPYPGAGASQAGLGEGAHACRKDTLERRERRLAAGRMAEVPTDLCPSPRLDRFFHHD